MITLKISRAGIAQSVEYSFMEREVSHSSPTNSFKGMWNRLAGVAPKEHVRCNEPPPSVNKAAHSGFEPQGRGHEKSKTGYQWPQK